MPKLRSFMKYTNQIILFVAFSITALQPQVHGQDTSAILGTWDTPFVVDEMFVQNGQTSFESFVTTFTLEFLPNNIANITEGNECEDVVYELTYSFSNGTVTIDDSASLVNGCEGDQSDSGSFQIEATLDASGNLVGTIAYQFTGIDASGNAFNGETIQPAPISAYRRPESETSGNEIVGAWDVIENLEETGLVDGISFGPYQFTIHEAWFFGADGMVTIVEFDECDEVGCDEVEDEDLISVPYSFDASTGTVTIDTTIMFQEDFYEETCIVDVDLDVTGDSLSGTLDEDCEDTDGTSEEWGTITGTRRVVAAQGSGEGEGEGEGEGDPGPISLKDPNTGIVCASGGNADGGIVGDLIVLLATLSLLVRWRCTHCADDTSNRNRP